MLPEPPERTFGKHQKAQQSAEGAKKMPRQAVKPSTLSEQQKRRVAGQRARADKVGTERWSKT